ncbi:MAG: class I SAM-dependent methyltransferase [Phycisphaerae bacterium]|nr:class I SAM-dependent methyltransferase [Phycisphaerae bacterium]
MIVTMSHSIQFGFSLLIVLCHAGYASPAAALKSGPYIHFERQGQVTVHWRSARAVSSVLEYTTPPGQGTFKRDSQPKTEHAVTLSVRPDTVTTCRIHIDNTATDYFQFDSTFEYGRDPVPEGVTPYETDDWTQVYDEAADAIVSQYGQTRGICIDYGCGTGRLAFEIARRSRLKVIGFESDAHKVSEARQRLDAAGIYGTHVVVHQMDLSDLACRDYLANLVVSDHLLRTGVLPGSWSEVGRIMRPDGGLASLGTALNPAKATLHQSIQAWAKSRQLNVIESHTQWTTVRRGPLAGSGSWDHFYADPANTANSTDTRITDTLQLLWYGAPGPRYITDRHNRPMTSLYKNGIVVTPGLDRLMVYDAYNGVRYWDMVMPDATRVSVQRDSAWVCLARDRVYAVHNNHCVALELKSGLPQQHFEMPESSLAHARWGYVATQQDRLYGSSQSVTASVIGQNRPKIMAFSYGDNLPIAVSHSMFCLERHTGKTQWTYGKEGTRRIINPSITLSEDAMVFIETTNPEALSDQSRLPASQLLVPSHTTLVKLDSRTGLELWRQPVTLPFEHMVYVQIAKEQQLIIATGARNLPDGPKDKIHYDVLAFNLDNGQGRWACHFNTGVDSGASHGEQEQHPVISADTLYTKYFTVDLRTGHAAAFSFSGANGGGCGTLSACATHIFGRAGNPFMLGQTNAQATRLTQETRPGCWVNMYPVGGLVLIPESSSGCSCDFPVQATLAFQPMAESIETNH